VTTRLAQPGDAGAIAVVHVRSWQAAYRNLVPQEFLDSLDTSARARSFYQAGGARTARSSRKSWRAPR
jgi:hypothetical protein